MTTEKLIIELDAKTSKLQKELNDTNKQLNSLDSNTTKADKSLASMTKVGGFAASAIASVGKAAVVAAAAVTTMAVASAKSNKEMELLSKQAKLGADEFRALAFATEQYGVNAEQIADISKDLADKLGEFATAGSGAFQDFVDVMGMTKEEGKELAKEFQNLSSDQVIGQMVKRMEDAGASSNQVTFALESMGNDLSKLAPLFSKNSEELKKLTTAFDAANSSMSITAEQSQDLQDLSAGFDLMTKTAGNAATSISATLAPVLTDFFNDVIQIIPQAEQAIVDFINRFIDVEKMSSLEDINEEFKRNTEIMESNQWAQEQLEQQIIVTGAAQDAQIKALELYNEAQERAEELIFRRMEVEEDAAARRLKDAEEQKRIASESRGGGGGTSGAIDSDLQAIADRFKSEEELLAQKYEKEREIAAGNKELLLELENEYIEALMELDITEEERKQEEFNKEIAAHQEMLSKKLISEEDYLKQVNKVAVKYGKLDEKQVKAVNKDKDKSNIEYTNDAINLSTQLFGSNQAVSSVTAFINTAEGVTKALASQDYAGAAFTAVAGAAQILSINSASIGGGSSPVASAPSSPPSSSPEQASVTGEVEVNESIGSGGQVSDTSNTITVTAQDSDAVTMALAGIVRDMINSGDIAPFPQG